MKRWVMNITTAASLVMCIGACWLWVRSYRWPDVLSYRVYTESQPAYIRTFFVCSETGRLQFAWGSYHVYVNPDKLATGYEPKFTDRPFSKTLNLGWRREFAGFGLIHDWDARLKYPDTFLTMKGISGGWIDEVRVTRWFKGFWIPYWAIVLGLIVLPARRFYVWRRERDRREKRLCVKCGYDMRGGGGRCPECGEVVLGSTGEADRATVRT